MIKAFEDHEPSLISPVKSALKRKADLGFKQLEPKSWATIKNISIDCAIMEKINNLAAVLYKSKWSI